MNIADNISPPNEIISLVEKKIGFFEDIIQNTLLHAKNVKMLGILTTNDVNNCVNTLCELSKKLKNIHLTLRESAGDLLIAELQLINNELSSLFKLYGTHSLDDMLWICFGNNYASLFSTKMTILEQAKFTLLKKYLHPINYKVINLGTKQPHKEDKKKGKPQPQSSAKEDNLLVELLNNLDCTDIPISDDKFHLKVSGIKIVIKHASQTKTLIVTGIIDDVIIDFLNNAYITHLTTALKNVAIPSPDANFERYVQSLTLKDYMIYGAQEVYSKYMGIQSNLTVIKAQPISATVKDFISGDMYYKRALIIQLLVNVSNNEFQYLAYLLYDLLSNDANGAIDTQEQTMLFDSFSWNTKSQFKDAMKQTVKYTTDLSNFDFNKIPLEQQICLLKVGDSVKEKAMQKLKEIKSKSDDSGSKARQYLEGLLKIPFSIYRKEPILHFSSIIKTKFAELLNLDPCAHGVPTSPQYTSIEIHKYVNQIKQGPHFPNIDYVKIKLNIMKQSKKSLTKCVPIINVFIQTNQMSYPLLLIDKKDKQTIASDVCSFLDNCTSNLRNELVKKLFANGEQSVISMKPVEQIVGEIDEKFKDINSYFEKIKVVMDSAIYGHDKAKRQIERIICQWINGELDGYCFGFEGPPGVGKTSLAKHGLSKCLENEHGEGRPFAMIQIGGDSNGSSLHGHNYTYVGSNWGSIVQILIDKKCMNPIIFIDEVDKISKTEQGREIVGILTHLLDSTQNDCFQDKYFSGIDIDMSKALFILSYNDAESIDKILLDRIHRIKFSNLSVEEKFVICKDHILPEIYNKMGLTGIVSISDEVIKYIIEEFTCEPGVRKLKEILFEIVGEVNKKSLKQMCDKEEQSIPIIITKELIRSEYLKDRKEIKHKRVHQESAVGIINGLWANSIGQGGVIQVQTSFVPNSKFLDLTLTGSQGDVMKESMSVALTLAWSLTSSARQSELHLTHNSKNASGIHIHCPEGATPKDGPSAGTAITCAIYSLLNDKKIKHDYAITGEMSLDGRVTEIGGLDLKILGGAKAGVKHFIYPAENHTDFEKLMEKYEHNGLLEGITFTKVSTISEVFALIFE
jgi:ATP-dependent Lon protease